MQQLKAPKKDLNDLLLHLVQSKDVLIRKVLT